MIMCCLVVVFCDLSCVLRWRLCAFVGVCHSLSTFCLISFVTHPVAHFSQLPPLQKREGEQRKAQKRKSPQRNKTFSVTHALNNNNNTIWRSVLNRRGAATPLRSWIMLSPKKVAQLNPSYPALCRQDTTSPWSTDYGGNICSQTLILMPAMKLFWKTYNKEEKRNTFFGRHEKEKWKTWKGGHPQMGLF